MNSKSLIFTCLAMAVLYANAVAAENRWAEAKKTSEQIVERSDKLFMQATEATRAKMEEIRRLAMALHDRVSKLGDKPGTVQDAEKVQADAKALQSQLMALAKDVTGDLRADTEAIHKLAVELEKQAKAAATK